MENLNLIRNIAWNFARKTGLNYQELFQEAALRYCYAVRDWKEAKKEDCKFTSFAYQRMNFRLVNFCKEETKVENTFDFKEAWMEHEEPQAEDAIPFMDVVEEWPEDAQAIVHMIFASPEKYEAATPNFRRNYVGQKRRLKKVKDDLLKKGWEASRIEQAVADIQSKLLIA